MPLLSNINCCHRGEPMQSRKNAPERAEHLAVVGFEDFIGRAVPGICSPGNDSKRPTESLCSKFDCDYYLFEIPHK
jgi:hypothetical protein